MFYNLKRTKTVLIGTSSVHEFFTFYYSNGILKCMREVAQECEFLLVVHATVIMVPRSLAKEQPWAEHLTSLPKRMWALFQVFPHLQP